MKRLGWVLLLGMLGCQREPAIVVRFDPADMTAARADLAVARDAATVRDGATEEARKLAVAEASCARDADCVLIPTDCCDCANGGKQRAVSRADGGRLRAAHESACKTVMCTMMVSTDPSCAQHASCVAGHCELRK